MTIEDVDWLLRYPCDEIALSSDTLAQVNATIANSKMHTESVSYRTSSDTTGRQVRTPHTLAGKQITVLPQIGHGQIELGIKGISVVKVSFLS